MVLANPTNNQLCSIEISTFSAQGTRGPFTYLRRQKNKTRALCVQPTRLAEQCFEKVAQIKAY